MILEFVSTVTSELYSSSFSQIVPMRLSLVVMCIVYISEFVQ